MALGCRDPKVHADIVREVTTAVEVLGFESKGVVESPILGGKGKNKEFLAHFVRRPGGAAGQ